jgi:hypothetical protein
MPVKVINKEALIDERFKNNRVDSVKVFKGDAKHNKALTKPETFNMKEFDNNDIPVKMTNTCYEGSYGQQQLFNEIDELADKIQAKLNAAQPPSQADIEAFFGKLFIDLTRRVQEAPDLTSKFATEITDLEAGETVNTRDLEKFIGRMTTIKGTNDAVELIEQKTGNTDSFDLDFTATGWKDSIKNQIYNKFFEMAKVAQAAVDADTDKRNSRTIGAIVGATFVASQKQAADTVGGTFDTKMYNTIRKGIKKLRALKDPRTNRKISVPKIFILCNSADTWDIERVISGQLTNGGANGTLTTQNAQALPISEIIEYDQGITDGYTYGKDTLAFPGVTAGKFYLYVPKEYLWVLNKRPLTRQTGQGSVLTLSTEETSWYRIDGVFDKYFLGSSHATAGYGAGIGAIIEVTAPTDS